MEAIDLFLNEKEKDVKVDLLSYWDFVSEETIDKLYPDAFTGWTLEHAGVMETSLMLYLYPNLVDMNRVQDLAPADLHLYDIYPIIPERTPKSGCLSSPKNASKEKGEILYNVCVEKISEALKKEYSMFVIIWSCIMGGSAIYYDIKSPGAILWITQAEFLLCLKI